MTITPPDDDNPSLPLALESYEGPLHLLLHLARTHKIDLSLISMAQLAEQYLQYINNQSNLNLDDAASWLVMAAWLAWLKSRLLLPQQQVDQDDEDAPEHLAALLAHKLQKLHAMRNAADAMFARPLLHRDVLPRGAPDDVLVSVSTHWHADQSLLLRSYAEMVARKQAPPSWRPAPQPVLPLAAARKWLETLQLNPSSWTNILSCLPPIHHSRRPRSALASTLTAALDMAREGRILIRQTEPFGEILLRSPSHER